MKKIFTLVMLSILTVCNMNAAEETLWEGDFNVSWDLPENDPNREWGTSEDQDVTAHFVTGAKINVYLTVVADAEYHKCQFDNWEWVALPGVSPMEFSEDTKVTIDVTEEIAAAVAEKGFRLHGHGFHVVKVTKGGSDDQPAVVSEEDLWTGDFNVSWNLAEGDPNREWGTSEDQNVTAHFVVGAKIFVYLTVVADAEYHKCQFDNWEWVALPGVSPVEFNENTKVTIDVTEEIATAVAEKGFRLHGHGFHVVKVSKKVSGTATVIGNTINRQAMDNQSIYNLQGMHITQPTKGLYIKNGKKVLVK
jgi:hypothetical protein